MGQTITIEVIRIDGSKSVEQFEDLGAIDLVRTSLSYSAQNFLYRRITSEYCSTTQTVTDYDEWFDDPRQPPETTRNETPVYFKDRVSHEIQELTSKPNKGTRLTIK